MSKRPYYVIVTTIDYEGYDLKINCISNSLKEIKKRYNATIRYYEKIYFTDEDIPEDDIRIDISKIPKNISVGQSVYSSISDDNCYITVMVHALDKDTFYNKRMEDYYNDIFNNR